MTLLWGSKIINKHESNFFIVMLTGQQETISIRFIDLIARFEFNGVCLLNVFKYHTCQMSITIIYFW